jgi:hypothetical protein
VLAVTSTYNFEEPVLDETISLLKKKLKFKKFFIRKILPKEVIPKDERVNNYKSIILGKYPHSRIL